MAVASDPEKRFGHCTQCGKRVFDQIGHPNDGATRVTFAMQNGSTAASTYCSDCSVNPDLALAHRVWLEAWSKGGGTERWHTSQAHNPPLGVLARESWLELLEGQR